MNRDKFQRKEGFWRSIFQDEKVQKNHLLTLPLFPLCCDGENKPENIKRRRRRRRYKGKILAVTALEEEEEEETSNNLEGVRSSDS